MNMKNDDFEKVGITKVGTIVKLHTAVDQIKSIFIELPVNIFGF